MTTDAKCTTQSMGILQVAWDLATLGGLGKLALWGVQGLGLGKFGA